jgi:hypothetical protein
MRYKEHLDHQNIRRYLELELAEATEYYRQIVADEELWISQNADVEALFQAKYYASSDAQFTLSNYAGDKLAEIVVFSAIALLLLASICLYFLHFTGRKKTRVANDQ